MSQPEIVFAADFLVLLNWRVAISLGTHSSERLDVNASGSVAIGGASGFVANVSGTLDVEEETADLKVYRCSPIGLTTNDVY